jgi:hypothetical protein
MVEAVVGKYMETEDPSFLVNTIRTVFISSSALNMSFRVWIGGVEVIENSYCGWLSRNHVMFYFYLRHLHLVGRERKVF